MNGRCTHSQVSVRPSRGAPRPGHGPSIRRRGLARAQGHRLVTGRRSFTGLA